MDNLDVNLNEVYDRVAECIHHNTPEQLDVYANAVRTMIDTLERDMETTDKALEPINNRIEELEAELKKIIAQVGATGPQDMGKVMGTATKALAGKAEGKAISALVKKLL